MNLREMKTFVPKYGFEVGAPPVNDQTYLSVARVKPLHRHRDITQTEMAPTVRAWHSGYKMYSVSWMFDNGWIGFRIVEIGCHYPHPVPKGWLWDQNHQVMDFGKLLNRMIETHSGLVYAI